MRKTLAKGTRSRVDGVRKTLAKGTRSRVDGVRKTLSRRTRSRLKLLVRLIHLKFRIRKVLMNQMLSLRDRAQGKISFNANFAYLDTTHYFCPDCSCEKFDLNSIVLNFKNSQDSNQIELLPMSRSELQTLATFFATGAKLGKASFLDHIPGIRFYISNSSHDSMLRKLQITIDNRLFYEVVVEANVLFRLAVSIGQTGKVCVHAKHRFVLAA